MADYNLKAEITADASGYEAGIKKAQKVSKNLSTTISGVIKGLGKNGLVGALGAVGLASQGLTSTLGAVVKIARRVSETVNECTNAYKNQLIAERELDTAIQNNPFVTGASADALKQFASEMQKVSNYGDEELIPMMANLVSLGRTEAETMQIMSVAMDMSAGMGISLDTAITQLNATLNGNIGRLGQQNAELKDLTEVELRSGKAIEILGEKFKGLSGATADTSKQLQNMKGDFKEALGQFTLPSSDMWNKFWIGFYEKGIEVINKINAFMDSQIIGKKLANAITEQIARINPADIGGRVDYTRSVLKVIGDDELEALKNYLSGLKKLSAEQEIILKRIKAEEDSRYQSTLNAKAEAEKAKERADAEAQVTAELQKQEELNKKKTDWASKLLDQRIEMLETERDRAISYAEEEGRETYSIWIDYNNKILELKLERLEKEKEKALAEEGLTAEDKIDIEEYYSGETQKIYNDLGNYKKKKNEEEKKDTKKTLSELVSYAKQYAEKIKQVFSKVVSTIKNVFSSGFELIRKLVSINVSDMLDNILAFEDAVLTFFVETLPQLPAFVNSVVQSIKTLLKTLKASIERENIAEAVFQMIKSIGDNLPEMVDDLLYILESVVGGALDGLLKWLDEEDGINTILNIVLSVQKSVEKFVTEGLDNIVTVIENHIDDFANFLAESMASANRTLPSLIKSILRLVNAIIQAIAKAFENEDFQNSIVESIEGVVGAIVEIAPKLVTSIVKLIFALINAIVPKLPEIILKILQEITGTLSGNISELVSELSKGLTTLFKKTMTFEFWRDVLQGFVQAFGTIVESALAPVSSGFQQAFEHNEDTQTGSQAGDVGLALLTGGISLLFKHANGTNNAPAGLSIVGEAGPELVKFRGGEQVLNNRNTNKALANMGGSTNNFNVTFNNLQDTTAFAMMNQFKQYNRQLAINGVM